MNRKMVSEATKRTADMYDDFFFIKITIDDIIRVYNYFLNFVLSNGHSNRL